MVLFTWGGDEKKVGQGGHVMPKPVTIQTYYQNEPRVGWAVRLQFINEKPITDWDKVQTTYIGGVYETEDQAKAKADQLLDFYEYTYSSEYTRSYERIEDGQTNVV